MAYTTTQLDAIKAAIATGELKVVFEGKEVVYRSISELQKAYDIIKAELIADGTISEPPRRAYASYTRA